MTATILNFPKADKLKAAVFKESKRDRAAVKPITTEVPTITPPLNHTWLDFCLPYMKERMFTGRAMSGKLTFKEEHYFRDHGNFVPWVNINDDPYHRRSSRIHIPLELMTFDFDLQPERDGSAAYSLHLKNLHLDEVLWIQGGRIQRKDSLRQYKWWWECPHGHKKRAFSLYIRMSDFKIRCASCPDMPGKRIELYGIQVREAE